MDIFNEINNLKIRINYRVLEPSHTKISVEKDKKKSATALIKNDSDISKKLDIKDKDKNGKNEKNKTDIIKIIDEETEGKESLEDETSCCKNGWI